MHTDTASKYLAISPRLLLSIYAVIPLALGFVALDVFLLHGALGATLPHEPESLLLFSLLFVLPHILASFFSFADREYLQHYKDVLLPGMQYAALFVILAPLISGMFALYAYAIFTMIHVFFQQAGISKILMHGANNMHTFWQWSGVVVATIIYVTAYEQFWFPYAESMSLIFLFAFALLTYTVFGLLAAHASRTRIGTLYFWGTHTLPIVSLLCLYAGYPLLALALPRVIHDLTAFLFYVTHDHNRALHTDANVLYRASTSLGLPIIVFSPLLAIALAYPLQSTSLYHYVLPLLMMCGLMHYYIEHHIWKHGSLHRRYVAIST